MKRFWDKVDKRGPDECWEWTGFTHPTGYGRVWYKGGCKNAHRVAWQITNGEIPFHDSYHGTCVLHKCDNRLCVNPAHLFLGTTSDNNQDRSKKGRNGNFSGSNNPSSKLSADSIRKIRSSYKNGETQVALAVAYGVSQANISSIVLNKSWSRVE